MSRALTRSERYRLAAAIAKRSSLRINVAASALTEAQAILLWQAVCSHEAYRSALNTVSPELGKAEVEQFRRALARQSGQLLDCTQRAVTLAEAKALWRVAKAIAPVRPPCRAHPVIAHIPRTAGSAVAVIAALPLAACASLLGGNVKGSFSCSAPGGTCAPSTVIDDTALAMIQNARPMTPAARPWSRPPMRGEGKVIAASNGVAHRDRRVVKVVFPSFVDQRGYLHEARIVHAVADPGGWMQLGDAGNAISAQWATQARQTVPIEPDGASAPSATGSTLLDPSVGAAKPDVTSIDPNAPSPGAVAAARARGLARLPTLPSEIKAAVDARLSVRPAPAIAATPVTDPEEAPAMVPNQQTDGSDVAAKGAAMGKDKQSEDAKQPPAVNAPTSFPGKVE
jgi:conjugal transfer pilus assembly protein TraV